MFNSDLLYNVNYISQKKIISNWAIKMFHSISKGNTLTLKCSTLKKLLK